MAFRVFKRLRDLLDVDATNIGNGKVPVYRTSSGKHEYETVSGGASAASDVTIADAGGYFAGTNVETVTQELGASVGSLPTSSQVVLQSLADAKGDIIAATAADTFARVAVGADGKVPVANANSAAGLMWAAQFGQPNYIATCYYGCIGTAGGATGGGYTYEVLYALPIFISKRQAFDRIALRCGGGTASLVVRLGIFSDANGPATLVLDAGTVDGASALADKTITISQTLDPGLYWLAAAPQAAGSIGSFSAARGGSTGAGLCPGLARADSVMSPSRCFFRLGVTGAFSSLTPAAADFAASQEGMDVRLRAA